MAKPNFAGKILSDTKRFFRKIPWFFGRQAFLIILFFMLLSIAFGGYLFYAYVVEPENRELKVQSDSLIFKESAYQNILNRWESEDNESSKSKNYINPFIKTLKK